MFRLLQFKPPHGWRAVVWELAIVTLGVLIALAAQQLVSTVNDRSIANETRRDVTDELNDGLASVALRDMAEPCIDRRLSELRQLFVTWATSGSFSTPQWVAQTPIVEITLPRYDAALSSGRITLLTGEEQYRIGAVVEGLRRFDQLQRDERLIWGRLRALQAGSEALSSGDKTMLIGALQDASAMNYETKIAARQVIPMASGFGYAADFRRVRAMAGRVWTSGKYTPSICTPIDTPRELANRTQVVPLPF